MLTRRDMLAWMALAPFSGARAAASRASRVVCTDWSGAETLLSLGVTPLAVTDRGGYGKILVEPPLPDGVADLGAAWAPNIELLQRLAPDMVLLPQWSTKHQPLSRIAPIMVLGNRSKEFDAIETAARELPGLGERIHAPRPAAQVIADFEAHIIKARESLKGTSHRPIIYVNLNADGRHVSIATETSLINDVLERLGLVNGWGRQANVWSFYATGVEQLVRAPADAQILYADQGEKTRIALKLLADNRIWNAIPAVREGRVTSVPPTYPYGGLHTAGRLADLITSAITAKGA